MASREFRNSGKVVNRLMSMNMDLTLSEYQVSRIKSGCSSLPVNKELVAIGMAHTIYKSLKEEEHGDVFTRQVSVKYNNTEDSGDEPPAKKAKREDSLFGPVHKLHPDWTRVVILKQAATFDGAQAQGNEKEKEYYVHCLYDLKNACFVDEHGNCLYVKRDQLLSQF